MGSPFGRCVQKREDCFAYIEKNGKCEALCDGDFNGKPCPFYKSVVKRKKKHIGGSLRKEQILFRSRKFGIDHLANDLIREKIGNE